MPIEEDSPSPSGSKRDTAQGLLEAFSPLWLKSTQPPPIPEEDEKSKGTTKLLKMNKNPKTRTTPKKVSFAADTRALKSGTAGRLPSDPGQSVNPGKNMDAVDAKFSEEVLLEDHVKIECGLSYGDDMVWVASRATSDPLYKDHPIVLLWRAPVVSEARPDDESYKLRGDKRKAGGKYQLEIASWIKNECFVPWVAAYETPEEVAIAYEFFPLSLAEVAICRDFEEPEMASILGKVIDGLKYLANEGYDHPNLSLSDVLVHTTGEVKIWGQYNCHKDGKDSLIERLRLITQGLLTGHEKGYDRTLNLSRWGDPDIQEFHELLARMSENHVDYLKLSTFEKLDKLSKFFKEVQGMSLTSTGMASNVEGTTAGRSSRLRCAWVRLVER